MRDDSLSPLVPDPTVVFANGYLTNSDATYRALYNDKYTA